LGTVFNNSTIVKFNEFNMFTSITSLPGAFRSCPQLQEIGLDNIVNGSGATAITQINSTKIEYAYLPNWVGFTGNRTRFFASLKYGLRIGKKCTDITNIVQSSSTPYFIIESEMVVGRSGSYANADHFFVPDAFVDAYKADSQWSSVAAKIYPISSFVQMFPNEPARMYEPW